jgi:hypothetical protein
MVNRKSVQATTLKQKQRLSGDNKVLIRRPQIFGDFGNMSAETSLGLATAWAAAVGGLLLIMILTRMFS